MRRYNGVVLFMYQLWCKSDDTLKVYNLIYLTQSVLQWQINDKSEMPSHNEKHELFVKKINVDHNRTICSTQYLHNIIFHVMKRKNEHTFLTHQTRWINMDSLIIRDIDLFVCSVENTELIINDAQLFFMLLFLPQHSQ